jgi:predicted dienelactone hydrolase
LASYGFAVVAPDHPGSDRQRLREFYGGLYRENFDASEYLDRPKDITFVLDQLEQINQTELGNRLDLDRVGIFGYSFGGSTALSLAGAELDFDFLQQDCRNETSLVNISLLYQCRALELPRETVSLKDDRIRAAFLFVPFGKSLFGEKGMAKANIPIFWEVTDLDVLTPLAVEQLPAFAALTTPDKYFAITEGLPHARVTYDALGKLSGSTTPWPTLKAIAHNYQNALSTAFFKTYVSQESQYSAYLQPGYAVALTQEPYSLSLVQSLDLPDR